jgi:CheY-like chemotaxis protein
MRKYANVLVVEDDQSSAFLLKLLLLDSDRVESISVTGNGQEAMDYICRLKANGSKLPELIFLDINMPLMDGFEFLEACKRVGCFEDKAVRVIILTSSNHPKDISKAGALGITDYLIKPISEEAVLSTIGAWGVK